MATRTTRSAVAPRRRRTRVQLLHLLFPAACCSPFFPFAGGQNPPRDALAGGRRSIAVEEEAAGGGDAVGMEEEGPLDSNAASAEQDGKALKICDVVGGLAATSLRSSAARSLFRGALEDAELATEYLTEAALNGARAGSGIFDKMKKSLDFEARNVTARDTVSAGIGYADDRADRRIDRFCSLAEEPFVGDKASEMEMVDAIADLLPWLVDRRSYNSSWLNEHQNGWTSDFEEPLPFPQLYKLGYLWSWGNCVIGYPSLQKLISHPSTYGDIWGENKTGQQRYIGYGHLTRDRRDAPFFFGPYTDALDSNTSLITAISFFDFSGAFGNRTYGFDAANVPDGLPEELPENRRSVYVAHVGFDISLTTVSQMFTNLEDALAEGSFAFLVNAETFKAISVSQSVVEKVYPERTGNEEDRNKDIHGDEAAEDRRNQTYTIGDTIHQSLVNLTNADWASLHQDVLNTPRGGRDYKIMDITLTTKDEALPYYVFWDRWAYVENWALLLMIPRHSLDNAINVSFSAETERANIVLENDNVKSEEQTIEIVNSGTLDVVIQARGKPTWLEFLRTAGEDGAAEALVSPRGYQLPAGRSVAVRYVVNSTGMDHGVVSSAMSFHVKDDAYSHCVYSDDLLYEISATLLRAEGLNQIQNVVPVGLTLMSIAIALSFFFATWTHLNRNVRIIRASQPFFLVMICAGTLVASSTIIPIGIDDKNFSVEACDMACISAPWLFCTGFTIAFSAIFAKLWRINQVFKANFRKIKVTERDVLKPFGILFAINFVVLLVWTVVDPLQWTRQPVQGGQPWETYGTCSSNGGTVSIVCMVLLIMVGLSALVLACIQAYMARAISDEYSESKFIGIAVICWLQVLVVGVPLLFLVQTNPTAKYFLMTTLIFVFSTSILLLVFVPKIAQKNKKAKGKKNVHVYGNQVTTTASSECADANTCRVSNPTGSQGLKITSPKLEIKDLQNEIQNLREANDELRTRIRELEAMQPKASSGGEKLATYAAAEDSAKVSCTPGLVVEDVQKKWKKWATF